MTRVRVQSHAGYMAEEEPRWVWLDGDRVEIVGIRDRWYDQNGRAFKVRTRTGEILLLQYDQQEDCWWLRSREATDA